MIARQGDSAPGPAAVRKLEPAPGYSATAIGLATRGPRVVVALASSGDAVRSHPDDRLRCAIELWQVALHP